MSHAEIERRVLGLLKSKSRGGNEPTLETNIIGETDMDSIAIMDFVLELEDEFDITIPLNRLADVATVGDLAHEIADIVDNSAGSRAQAVKIGESR